MTINKTYPSILSDLRVTITTVLLADDIFPNMYNLTLTISSMKLSNVSNTNKHLILSTINNTQFVTDLNNEFKSQTSKSAGIDIMNINIYSTDISNDPTKNPDKNNSTNHKVFSFFKNINLQVLIGVIVLFIAYILLIILCIYCKLKRKDEIVRNSIYEMSVKKFKTSKTKESDSNTFVPLESTTKYTSNTNTIRDYNSPRGSKGWSEDFLKNESDVNYIRMGDYDI